MAMQRSSDADLYTHKEDGGLYYYNGTARGTGEDRGKTLHIYTNYFTEETFYREPSTWTDRMVALRAPGLRLARQGNPGFLIMMIVFLGCLSLGEYLRTQTFPTMEGIFAALAAGALAMWLLKYPITWLYRWKYHKS